MKGCALFVIAILLFVLWPEAEAQKATPAAKAAQSSQSSRATHSRRVGQQALSSRLAQATDENLQSRIMERWPTISSDLPARDASVVEFIRILREMGRRDGPGALAFLHQLDQTDKEALWYMARMAVAGGWSISDPEAAVLALLEKDNVLPSHAQSFFGGRNQDPTNLALKRASTDIFEAFIARSPDQAQQVATELVSESAGWGAHIFTNLIKIAFPDENFVITGSLGNSRIDRNTIDAILNNPNRTALIAYFVGSTTPPTDQMKGLGEPALTQAEWAARNPNHAIDLIRQSVNETERLEPQLIAGMARNNPNYRELLALAPPSQRFEVAEYLAETSRSNSDEMVWQLAGRETTWIISEDQRREAFEYLIEIEGFPPKEKQMLKLIAEGQSYPTPELPNQTKRPD